MKKLFMLAAIAAVTATAATTANAQWRTDYQGEVQLGYSIGSTGSYDRVNIHTLHGVRFNDYLFAGIGAGLDIYTGVDFFDGDPATREVQYGTRAQLAIPVYLNVRGFLPVATRLDIFAGVDVGYSIDISKKATLGTDMNGFLCMPQAGLAYKMKDGSAFTFTFGYELGNARNTYKGLVGDVSKRVGNNAITLKLGFQF